MCFVLYFHQDKILWHLLWDAGWTFNNFEKDIEGSSTSEEDIDSAVNEDSRSSSHDEFIPENRID